jgi:IS4 transposase
VAWDAENEREIVLLTNLLEFGATTIAAIYKERWQIELLFKALKQNLTVKTFVGTSENALRIQIWTALTALLLLKWLRPLQGRLVSVQSGFDAAPKPVYLPRIDPVD